MSSSRRKDLLVLVQSGELPPPTPISRRRPLGSSPLRSSEASPPIRATISTRSPFLCRKRSGRCRQWRWSSRRRTRPQTFRWGSPISVPPSTTRRSSFRPDPFWCIRAICTPRGSVGPGSGSPPATGSSPWAGGWSRYPEARLPISGGREAPLASEARREGTLAPSPLPLWSSTVFPNLAPPVPANASLQINPINWFGHSSIDY